MGTKSCWGGAMKNVNLVTYIFGVLRVQLPEVERLVENPKGRPRQKLGK